jgi:hypothetical protein
MNFELGVSRSLDDLLSEIGDRVNTLESGKLHIPSFTQFQFGELKESSNLHKNVIQLLKSHNLFNPSDTLDKGLVKGPSKGKGKGIGNSNGNGKEEVKVRIKYSEDFDSVWHAYGLKGNKKKAFGHWTKMTEEDKSKATEAIPAYLKEKPEAKYRKDFERYLSDRVYDDVLERKQHEPPKKERSYGLH